MKKLLYVLSAFGILSVNVCASDDLAEARAAAEKGYSSFLSLCFSAPHALENHGLSADDGVENVTLGDPYPLYQLPSDAIKNYKNGSDIKQSLTWNNTFLVPVYFNGILKLMLTVAKYTPEGDYEIGALGDRYLALELRKLEVEWPRNKILDDANQPLLCVNQDTREYAVHIPQDSRFNLTILNVGGEMTKSNEDVYGTLQTADGAMVELKSKLAAVEKRGKLW